MKRLIVFVALISTCVFYAQERYIDSSFALQETVTRTYAVKDNKDLKLDVYQPEDESLVERPMIVFMHGGGFATGARDNKDEVKFAKMAAERGYVSVFISYRLTRKSKSFGCDFAASGKIETFKKGAEDFLDAVNYMIKHQQVFRIDPSRIIAAGSSAGAESILNLVYNRSLLFEDSEKIPNIHFAGVFALSGALLDARYINRQTAIPGVFFHGTADHLVPYATDSHHQCHVGAPGYLMLDGSRRITKRLGELGSSYMLFSFEGAGHEIAQIPFDDLPEVFSYFKHVFLKGNAQQVEVVRPKQWSVWAH